MDYKLYDVKIDDAGKVQYANCSLENGFEFSVISFRRSLLLAVIDGRHWGDTVPAGIISNLESCTIDIIEDTVKKIIHLYKSREIISMAKDLEEFNSVFKRLA